MICPFRNIRVGKLYMPPGGDRFVSRQAWRLGYQCQHDAAGEPIRTAGPATEEAGLHRPKGMWHRTFERHLERYWQLDDECAAEMALLFGRPV